MMTGNWGAILISAIVIGSIYLWWKGGLKRPNVPTGWMTWPAWADSQAAAIVLGVVFILLIMKIALPSATAAIAAAVSWPLLIMGAAITTVLLIRLSGAWRTGLVGTVAVLLLIAVFSSPSCAPGDTTCIEAQRQATIAEAKAKAEAQAAAKKASSVTLECPGKPNIFEIGLSEPPKIINPNSCQLRWKIRIGCVRAYDRSGKVLANKVCVGDEGGGPPGLYSLAALDGPAKVHRIECSRYAIGDFLNGCE